MVISGQLQTIYPVSTSLRGKAAIQNYWYQIIYPTKNNFITEDLNLTYVKFSPYSSAIVGHGIISIGVSLHFDCRVIESPLFDLDLNQVH